MDNKIKNDLISVVVVTYNSSKTVIDTLESIRNQTYNDIELVVSDDCSTDDTLVVVKKWIMRYRKRFLGVRLLNAHRNHGVVKNCNIGAFQTRGRYIQFIAGDDVLFTNALDAKYQFAEQNKLKFVVSKVAISGNDKNNVEYMSDFAEKGYRIINAGLDVQRSAIVADNIIVGPAGAFYRRDFFFGQGMYDIRFPMLEDHPFIYKYLKEGNKIVLLDEQLAEYRLGDASLCTACRNKRFIDSYLAFFALIRFPELLKQGRVCDIIKSFEAYIYFVYNYLKNTILTS